jgi:hypothetical protein
VGVGHRFRDMIVEDRSILSCTGYPAGPCDQWLLADAFDTGLEAGISYFRGLMIVLVRMGRVR